MGRFDDRATTPNRGFKDVLRWRFGLGGSDAERPRREATGAFTPPRRAPDAGLLGSGDAQLTWIGHATFLLTLGGKRILIDPVFAPKIGPIPRISPPGIALQDLPPIDLVLITHNHRDHLDAWTISRLGNGPSYIAPLGHRSLLEKLGATRVTELDWWQSTEIGSLVITLVPARHWSMRFPWDRNDMLWGGYTLRGPEGIAYHSGDTGFFDGFAEIGQRTGPIDWAMLPIGAYEPRWFMAPQHMNPQEAVEAARLLQARTMVAMHWGTFRLTDEPLAEPPVRAREAHRGRGAADDSLWVLDIGETRPLTRR